MTMKIIHDVERLSEYWWLVLLRGVFALAFAAVVWVATGVLRLDYGQSIGLVFIEACFGGYLLVAGLFSISMAVMVLRDHHWPVTVVHSALLLALAAWLMYSDADPIVPLAALVAVHAVVSGMGEISLARRMRRHQMQGAALVGAALFSFGAAVVLVLEMRNVERLIVVTSAYAAVFGAVLIATSFQLRALRRQAMSAAQA
ncbi:MAG: hypothetical protein HYX28_03635 [Candidatus Koribacter versatilis]|uniref:Uncharacterized protein n=1 Tax=Candidatus Korobacter versatilis TaxID=658062 RepID=A0A932A817_9BACT|nr:hypothetical protein [Candidatus Koribacter versatilis]